MNKDIDKLSNQLSKLQIRRVEIVIELESVEKQILKIFEDKSKTTTRLPVKDETGTRTPAAIERTGRFIVKGDYVRVLTSEAYKGETVVAIEVNDNKVSIKRPSDDKSRPSWRLSHNLLKISKSKIEQ